MNKMIRCYSEKGYDQNDGFIECTIGIYRFEYNSVNCSYHMQLKQFKKQIGTMINAVANWLLIRLQGNDI